MTSRREFLGGVGAWAASGLVRREADITLLDYHVHLEGAITLQRALELSKERGIGFGIVQHAGTEAKRKSYPEIISSDAAMRRHVAGLAATPFLKGIQAEGLDWMTCFSKDAVAELDYVLSDALTLPEKDGSFTELWWPSVKIAGKQDFMERYVEFHVQVISREPIDILANPLYMPQCLEAEYDALWTPARMRAVADAALKHKVAIEINEAFRLPRKPFLRMAREAGLKFSFGSNQHNETIGKLDYAREVIREFKLEPADIWTPAPKGLKPIQVRKF